MSTPKNGKEKAAVLHEDSCHLWRLAAQEALCWLPDAAPLFIAAQASSPHTSPPEGAAAGLICPHHALEAHDQVWSVTPAALEGEAG